MKNRVWATTLFEELDKLGITIPEFCRRGGNVYTTAYLNTIRSGAARVPDSLNFQDWAAAVLGVRRDEIFFPAPFSTSNEMISPIKAAS